MRKLFHGLKTLDPMLTAALVLTFAVAFMLGQQTTSREVKKHYIVDASEVEIVNHNPYKALTLSECVTDYECNIAQLLDDQANGRIVSTDDPIFFPDSVPVIEPIDYEQGESPSDYEQGESPSDYEQGESPSECETGDKECEKANKLNAGKPAHYPAICEPYIFDTKL